jgi:photosystem II stability/assembly factor-like uncharacterized protein
MSLIERALRQLSARPLGSTGVALILTLGAVTSALAQEVTPDLYSALQYRYIGPPGNRTSAVVGVPGNPMVYYIGASSGGIWKSTDAGLNWDPIFDDQPAQSIGAIAIAPSDPNIVWAGTGEPWVRSNVSIGNGVYKSTDAGRTWQHMGLDKTGRIGRVVIDPRNPDIVHVAAIGNGYGPQQERGIFRTTDGGETWEQTLFIDENTGVFEIAMDPSNPRLLLAGAWPLVIHTWGRESGGPRGGIYRSRDAGATWERIEGHGLPDPPIGKVGLAFAPSNPDIVYALMETGFPNRGVLWRSTDRGENWTLRSYDRLLNERPHYASRLMVNPADENEVYFAANSHSISYDGGLTTELSRWGGDTHDMWADPMIPDRMMISHDGGVSITINRGKSWNRVNLPNAQMYHVNVDDQIPYNVYGGKQDGSGYKGSSTSGLGGRRGGSGSQWQSSAGCESGFVVPDPDNADIVWGGCYMGGFTKVDYRTGHRRTVQVWPESVYGAAARDAKYRFNWTFPIALSPHDPNKVYVGSQYVHQTTDGGESWQIISPDLSTNDPRFLGPSGGLTKDNIGVEWAEAVFAIAESPLEAGQIWAGTNDGLVHVTRDGGQNWTNVTGNIPDLPEWGTVNNIEPSKHVNGTAYITVDFHQMDNRDPFVYKTTDFGEHWTSISSDIPRSVFSYANWIHEDPVRPGLLYLGTENAIYVSFNDGERWLPLQNNLPHAPVHGIVVQTRFNDLVLATYGRGFWIMDDITPLQQLTDDVLASEVFLFVPRPTYRMHNVTGGPTANATAYINYYLGQTPAGAVDIEILDDRGETVKELRGTRRAGINRVAWDLRYEGAREARLRTRPPGNPHVVEEKRFRTTWEREGWYPIESWGTSAGFRGIVVAPGTYTVRLTVGDQTYTQELVILKDPRSDGTVADIEAQVGLALELRDDLNDASDMISEIEVTKRTLTDLRGAMEREEDSTRVLAGADSLYARLQALEDKLLQPILAEGDSKSFRYPNRLYSQLSFLIGDLGSSVDFAPNEQQKEVRKVLKARLLQYQDEFKVLRENDIAAFNRLVRGRLIS